MAYLSGLKDLKGKVEVNDCFRSVTSGIKGLKKARAKIAGGSRGSISIWCDDNGIYRGERYHLCITQTSFDGKTAKELKAWLKAELPLIY